MTVNENAERLLRLIAGKGAFQSRYIDKIKTQVLSRREYDILGFLTQFLCDQGISMEQQAEAYVALSRAFMEEQVYFRRHHVYSKSNYSEICQTVYANSQYMSGYMIGLAISGCIWYDHIHVLRWYEEELKAVCKSGIRTYLEIGCGMGINLLHTMEAMDAERYLVADLSEKSVELCKALLAYAEAREVIRDKNYTIERSDFFAYEPSEKADVFTMFEVLEHVPNPEEMLERIQYVTTEEAEIFVSTAINAPAPDHIYLFSSVGEVLRMVEKCGFSVENMVCAASNGVEVEVAERKELPITIALRLRKRPAARA